MVWNGILFSNSFLYVAPIQTKNLWRIQNLTQSKVHTMGCEVKGSSSVLLHTGRFLGQVARVCVCVCHWTSTAARVEDRTKRFLLTRRVCGFFGYAMCHDHTLASTEHAERMEARSMQLCKADGVGWTSCLCESEVRLPIKSENALWPRS